MAESRQVDSRNKRAEVVQLYDVASPELHRLLVRKLGNAEDAREVAQDTFEKLLRQAEREDIRDVRRLAFTVANRLALDVLRRRRVKDGYLREQGEASDGLATRDDPERLSMGHEQMLAVQRALTVLPPKTRDVFLLHRFESYAIGIETGGLRGDFTIADALDRLLADTGLEYRAKGEAVIVSRPVAQLTRAAEPERKPLLRRVGTALAAGLLAMAGTGATAAEDDDDGRAEAAREDEPDKVVEEIIVTGTRIGLPASQVSSPVLVIDAEALADSGEFNLERVLEYRSNSWSGWRYNSTALPPYTVGRHRRRNQRHTQEGLRRHDGRSQAQQMDGRRRRRNHECIRRHHQVVDNG